MTSTCTAASKHNFYCVVKACLELINLPLVDILATYVKDVDLFNRINSCPNLLSGRNKLRIDQQKICYLTPPAVPDYKKFDITLLYTLIRNLCHSLRPTQGWGSEPKITDTQLGDDIERLRLFRNKYCAHAVFDEIPDTEFEILWRNLKSVINRIQSKTTSSVNYEQELIKIEKSKFDQDYLEKYKLLLEALLKLQTDDKDEPEVVIKGKDEVLCGDLAQFEAVLKPHSSCWSITWHRRRGDILEFINTSKREYSGSAKRKLVIQSVSKKDEGEYQVLLAHESNGNGYLKRGPSFRLHVIGELPLLNHLEVTTGDEGIIILYSYNVPGQWPKVQHIEWSKNGQVLVTNTSKYSGGSIHDRSLTIKLPTEEDKGQYSCKITNAVGCASKDVMLDVPRVDISVKPKVHFGSKATITAVVSSTPSPEHVKWQKSKDGNNFYCLDVTKSNYYGSNDAPLKPLLVIPKATFDDKLYYRLLVRNKIRDSVSDAVYLNVTGSPPNITTSQETSIKFKLLKLIGNVSLYDDSPDILEVFWTKNGEKIDTRGSGGRLSEVTIGNPSLIIRDVNFDDAGNYQLTAVNAVGSTTSDVIALDVPGVIFENTENKENGTKRYVVTIQSVPSPLSVQWSSKGKNEDVYTPLDCNGEDYKGTINTIPHPVLVVNKSHLRNYNYQIEVTNFFGCTVKQISDNEHHLTENVTKENKVYKDRNAGIKFAKLCNSLAEHFPHQKLHNLKLMLIGSEKVGNLSALFSAKSAAECFTILYEENVFTQKDVIFMQFLLKEMGCDELYSQCIKYALTNKALCYFENQPDYGYTNVQFHIQGDLNDYTKERIEHIVEVVADILECKTQDVFVNGVKPSNSFFLVLSLNEVYTRKLTELNAQDRRRLMKLDIDFIIVDLKVIVLQRFEVANRGSDGTTFLVNLSTNIERRRNIEKEREKKGKFNLAWRTPKKQQDAWGVQERFFTAEKDQSNIKVNTDSTVEQDIKSHLVANRGSYGTGFHLSTNIEKRNIEKEREKKGEFNLACKPPKKQLEAWGVQERSVTVEKDQSKIKVHTDSTGEQNIKSHLGLPLISHYIQSHNFSSKAKTRTNPDEKNILKIKEDLRFVPDTFALASDQTKIQPEKLIQTSKRLVFHQSQIGHLNDLKRMHKGDIFTRHDDSVRRKYLYSGSGQILKRPAAYEPKMRYFSRECAFPSVLIPNKVDSTGSENYDDDDDGDDVDVDDNVAGFDYYPCHFDD